MKSKLWIIGWASMSAMILAGFAFCAYKVDPYFHYHAPKKEIYYYIINNQRSQNDGIIRNFEYDGLITGTSMTENFKTTEMDAIFGTKSIKVPFSGATYKELNQNIERALKYNPELRIVIRSLDMSMFFDSADRMRTAMGEYPTYLYDSNPFNDVKYLSNKDIINLVVQMIMINDEADFTPGITSFDEYANWQYSTSYGKNHVCPEGVSLQLPDEYSHLSDKEKETIRKNINENVTSLADKYPDTTFYYFFPPYSAVWWKEQLEEGNIYRQLEAEEYIISLIVEHNNIKLYSFNDFYDMTTDLNNYEDHYHYAQWVNSAILMWMAEEKGLLTKDNYKDYIEGTKQFYTSFDYLSINEQEDFENDMYQAGLFKGQIKN